MASSEYIGGSKKYTGTVEYVCKTYGFIHLDNKQPVARAFFDQASANMQGCDLKNTFSQGCKISTNIIPTDGEHKVKHKAANLALFTPVVYKDDPSIRGGDHYLRKYLMDHGPFTLDKLAERLSSATDNCPRFLKKGNKEDIEKVVTCHSETFQMKNNVLCLIEIENEIRNEFLENMKSYDNSIPIEAVNGIIRPDDKNRRYLHTVDQWNIGIKDFIARNADEFIFWDSKIWNKKYVKENQQICTRFKREMAAVRFYSKFVKEKSPVAVKSLMGHWNQADDDVKEVSCPREQEFTEFLEKNSFFFILRGGMVKECPEHRLAVIDNFWLKTKTRGKRAKKLTKDVQQHDSCQTSPAKPSPGHKRMSAQQTNALSKAWNSDMDFEKSIKRPIPCSSEAESDNPSTTSQYFLPVTSFSPPPPLLQKQSSTGSEKRIFRSNDAKIYKQLAGETISHALEEEFHQRGQGLSLNCLLLLRMNIGKPPMAKFRTTGESGSSNCSLKTEAVKTEDLQNILRKKEVVKSVTPQHYGIKGTLHSIRTLEQGGKVIGLTLFCQLHESNDGLALDIFNGKKLSAIFTGNYPTKYIYNYLRSKCKALLSKSEDVLVIDVDGQLSGCDDQPHPSLGDVSRILCSSSSELAGKINGAIDHVHEYVIVVGVDSFDQLKSLQRMSSKGTKVIAEVSSDLRSQVGTMFS